MNPKYYLLAAVAALSLGACSKDDTRPGSGNDPIRFEDPTVKEICIDNWDANGDGELSYDEAAAVKSIGSRFKETSIRSFNELRYFTGLRSVGEDAFCDCDNLTSIRIPDKVTAIGYCAFMRCSSLASIDLPDGVTMIDEDAFSYCHSLTSIDLPDKVTEIKYRTFTSCINLTDVDIPDGVTAIGQSAFEYCNSLARIDLPKKVTTIGFAAFKSCKSLTSIDIPERVTAIEDQAFYDCSSLKSVYCKPATPPTLGRSVFAWTSAIKIYVPAASYQAYVTAENWGQYSSQIYAN